MNNNKLIAVAAVAIIVLAGIGIAYTLTRDNSSDGSNIIIDARGRAVVIPDEINSILAIKSCSLQLVSFFDAVDKVKNLDVNESFTDVNRTHTFILKDLLNGDGVRYEDLPRVDTSSAEQVINAKVDIVISSSVAVSALDSEQSRFGVPVFAINADLEFDSPEMYYQLFALGRLFGEEQRAVDLVYGIQSLVHGITDKVGDASGKGYACGMNFMGANATPFLRASGDYLPFTYSKLENVSVHSSMGVGGQPYDTSQEAVIEKKPTVIFIDGMGLNATVDYIKNNKGTLNLIPAISNGEIYKTMVYKNWGTNWVNQMINVYYVASIVHKTDTVFDWTFENKANEIIQLFYPGTTVTYSELAGAQAGGVCRQITL